MTFLRILVKAGYIRYEFHFRGIKEALFEKGNSVENYGPRPSPRFSGGESKVSSKITPRHEVTWESQDLARCL